MRRFLMKMALVTVGCSVLFAQSTNKSVRNLSAGSRRAHADLAWARGAELLDRREFDAAIAQFQKGLAMEPHDPALLTSLGCARIGLLDYEGAIRNFDQALREEPGYAEAYLAMGEAYLQIGDKKGAEDNFRTLAMLRPLDEYFASRLPVLLNEEGRTKDMEEYYASGLRDHPESDFFLEGWLSSVSRNRGPRAAIDEANKRLAAGARSIALERTLGQAYFDVNDFRNAIPHLEIAAGGNPNDMDLEVFRTLAVAYYRTGDHKTCMERIEEYARREGRSELLNPDYCK